MSRFNIVLKDTVSEYIGTTLKDKNLSILVKNSQGKQLTAMYTLLDSDDKGEVFKDFSTNVIGFLAQRLSAEQLSETLTFEIFRNDELVYVFEADYKSFRKTMASYFRTEVDDAHIAQGIRATKESIKDGVAQIKEQTNTLILLGVFSDIAVKIGHNISYETYQSLEFEDAEIVE